MVVSDIFDSANAFIGLAHIIQQTGERWYSTSGAYQIFKSNVKKIEDSLKGWRSLAEKYGLSSEEALQHRLDEANKLLQAEKARLEHLNKRNIRWCWYRCQLVLNWAPFPSPLSEKTENLTNMILADWERHKATESAAQDQVRAKVWHEAWRQFHFRKDERYVRLPEIERDIKNALEDPSMTAVLLEGPAGTGKSCMARCLALDYREDIERASHAVSGTKRSARTASVQTDEVVPPSHTSRSGEDPSRSCASCLGKCFALDYQEYKLQASVPETRSSGTPVCSPPCNTSRTREGRESGDPSCVFDQVFFIECGHAADLEAKQKEILELLDWRDHESLEKLKEVEGEQKTHLKGVLQSLLKNRKVLIIFDDVWEDHLLEDMVSVSGNGVKILVTSQKLRLCPRVGGSYAHISMNIMEADAKRILQKLAGFNAGDRISEPIQKCMTELVRVSSANPHIMASLATAIDSARRGEQEHWDTVILGKEKLLGHQGERPIEIQGMKYSSSTAIKFRRLNPEEMNLMVLMSMLEGTSVPECVIQLLSSDTMVEGEVGNCRLCPLFSIFRKNLQDLRCIEVTKFDGQYFWSIRNLDREFLLKDRADHVKSILVKFQTLSKKNQGLEGEQEHVLKLLAALFLTKKWADDVMTGLSFPLREKVRSRSAIRGILALMLRNTLHDWSLAQRSAADQVFLSYICHSALHEDASRILTRSAVSKNILVDTVIKLVGIADISLSEGLIMGLLSTKGKLTCLHQNYDALDINLEQCRLLRSLAWREGGVTGHAVRWSLCRRQIVSGLLEAFKCKSNKLDLRCLSIETIGYMGRGISPRQGEDTVAFLVEFPNLLSELGFVLEENTCPDLQHSAALALCTFARFARDYGRVRLTIAETTGKHLVRSLAQNSNMELQRWAVWALNNLAGGGRQISLKILDYPHAMDYILTTLGLQSDREEFDDVRKGAAYALWNILRAIFPSPVPDVSDLVQRVSESLVQMLKREDRLPSDAEKVAVGILTWIDTEKAKGLQQVSRAAFKLRGSRLVQLGHFEDGLSDLKEADQQYDMKDFNTCIYLVQAEAKLKLWDAALKDANRAVELANASGDTEQMSDALQERGVLKCMKEDLQGALQDLNDVLTLDPDDYEMKKHRAYVKFLLDDIDEARKDAEAVVPLKPSWYDRSLNETECLGTSMVEFLDFRL